MAECNGKIIFACGRGYSEVPQKAIDEISIGTKLKVWTNEGDINHPKPTGEITCLGCPCKRKAKRKQDMFYRESDKDPESNRTIRRPTGIVVLCAIAELVPDTERRIKEYEATI